MNQKRLKLASRRQNIPQVRTRHEGADIGHHVAKRGVKDEAIDGLVKGARHAKRNDGKEAPEQRQHRAAPLNGADGLELVFCERGGHCRRRCRRRQCEEQTEDEEDGRREAGVMGGGNAKGTGREWRGEDLV